MNCKNRSPGVQFRWTKSERVIFIRRVDIFAGAGGFSRPRLGKYVLVSLLAVLPLGTWAEKLSAQKPPAAANTAQPPSHAQQTPDQLQQLVAPIALYPDSLVAQILVAATFPEQIVEADRWLQAHPDLKGEALAKAVDLKPWDPSVKALTAFPSVLGNMDKNLSWTSSLGDAYYNNQDEVLDAIKVMRERAKEAGTLKSTPQETVGMEDSTISIEPASSDQVYVPEYDPWLAYGNPIDAWQDWYPYPGIWYDGVGCWFGPAFPVGYFGGFDWGWGHWGFDRHHRFVTHNDNRYYSRSTTFYNRGAYYRGGSRAVANSAARGLNSRANAATVPSRESAAGRSSVVPEGLRGNFEENRRSSVTADEHGAYNRPGATINPFGGNIQAARGYAAPRGQSGIRSGAFSGYGNGGMARGFSARGGASFSGGASRGGGGHR